MLGPGVYDDACTKAREMTEGNTVILIVLNGKSGHGLSIHSCNPMIQVEVPGMLRKIADGIEKDLTKNIS